MEITLGGLFAMLVFLSFMMYKDHAALENNINSKFEKLNKRIDWIEKKLDN